MSRKGKIYVVGLGTGNKDNMTFRAYKGRIFWKGT